jgi:hypothetical protein
MMSEANHRIGDGPPNAQPLLADVVEEFASFSFCAHSSQHTSTVLPPILTSIDAPSSVQSQAAQVFSAITLLSLPEVRVRAVDRVGGKGRYRNL